jgi:hypothetical protein
MRIQCKHDSVQEYETTRQWVWLYRKGYAPPKALTGGKITDAWMGRVTRRHHDVTEYYLDGSGSELYIYAERDNYHWYIARTGSRNTLARGVRETLEYAAEELYLAFFGLMTRDAFRPALLPQVGKQVVLMGDWVQYGRLSNTVTRDDNGNAFVVGGPGKHYYLTTIVKVDRISLQSNDAFNWVLTVENGFKVTGLDWRIYCPEQYVSQDYPLQCCMCRNVSPKAFDIKWVHGSGAMCGMSRDHYMADHDIIKADNCDAHIQTFVS